MFEKILYPTDFSDVSKKALDYIKKLKDAGTKEVIVLHVIDEREMTNVSRYASAYLNNAELEKRMEENVNEEAGATAEELQKSGFDVKLRIKTGIPLTEIFKAEEQEALSAVVIGSHGKSCVQEMLLGSVSEKVVRKSKKPVLIVRR